MFFLIPFGIFLAAFAAIIWVIARKFVYLKKLAPETLEETMATEKNFWAELYPEIAAYWKRVNLRAYGVNVLNEFEKFLRKMRLLSMRADDLTNRLIRQVRKSSQKHGEILEKEAAAEEEKQAEEENLELEDLGNSQEELKQKEQLLIIEIAKHPKDAQLYKELGTVYMRLENWEDARQSFEKVIELDPADEAIKRKLGRALSKIKKEEKPE